jgi:D-aminopeptidase
MVASSWADERPRIRDLGVTPGILPTGEYNAITDVGGVKVGHRSLIEGEDIRTGVTVIVPHGGNVFQSKVPAAVYVGNGFGKAAGFLQVDELGNLETPIVLTNTLCVARAVEGVVRWTLAQPGNENVQSVNAVVGETNDGYLNDIRRMSVTTADVLAAINDAKTGPVEEGSVGAGVGTRCLGFKGGIGTASRKLPAKAGGYTVGALVQTNYGGVLQIDGARVGEKLGRHAMIDLLGSTGREKESEQTTPAANTGGDGSVMIVLATDAPLSHRNLKRLARRAVLGLARTGSYMSNGSGDFVIAFSTRNLEEHEPSEPSRRVELLSNDFVGPIFLAAVESVEEAVGNSLVAATTMTGHGGRTVESIPVEKLRQLLRNRPTPPR